jgi:polysaccharide biosynthesis protein PslH
MKVLVLTPSFPSPTWGAGTRNYYFLKALAKYHRVSLLSLIEKKEDLEQISLLEDFVHSVKYVQRPPVRKRMKQLTYLARLRSYSIESNVLAEVQAALDAFFAEDDYDAVLFESVFVSNYRLPAGIKRLVDQHNVEYEVLWRTFRNESGGWRKWYNWWESRILKPAEIKLCRRADLVLTTSERDSRILKRVLPSTAIEVVPNGVDIRVFQSDSTEPTPYQIIFTGAMNYYPNIDAVISFARNCWPLIREQVPQATWVIAGREPPLEVKSLEDLPGVTVTGSVPDVRPYLAASAVAIAPLQIGGGTRLKILEAFAMSKAVVSTSIGCEGLAVASEEHLLVADRPEEFAQAVIKFLNNPEMRTSFGRAGRALVEAEYSWERCGAQLLHALETHIPEREQVC